MQLHELLYKSISKYDVCYGPFCGTFRISLIWIPRVRNPPKWKFGVGAREWRTQKQHLWVWDLKYFWLQVLRTTQPALPMWLRNFLLVLDLKQNKNLKNHKWIFFVCVYTCVCVRVLCMSRSTAHICTCLQRTEVSVGCLPQLFLLLKFWDSVSYWSWSSLFQLCCLTNELPVSVP